ncbi:MAG: hypothetical protein AB7E47_05800 [Desulfovibrionaceae bacterium]
MSDNYAPFIHTFTDRFADDAQVVVSYRLRRPTPAQASRVQKNLLKDPVLAMRNLCVDLVHEEDKNGMVDDFTKYPGLSTTIGGAVLKAVGFGDLGN